MSDVKPHNVGFSASGQLKLFDFGLATCIPRRVLASDTYQMSGLTGTLAYMAPEVALGLPYSDKVDVFSFAVVLWQLLSGCSSPFSDSMTRKEYQKLVAIDGKRPSLLLPNYGDKKEKQLKEELLELVEQCWSGDPITRPSAAETTHRLDQLLLLSTTNYDAVDEVTTGTSKSWRLLDKLVKYFKVSSKSNSVLPADNDASRTSQGESPSLKYKLKRNRNYNPL